MSEDSFSSFPTFHEVRFSVVLGDLSICVGMGEGWDTGLRLSVPLASLGANAPGCLLSLPAPLDCEVLQTGPGFILFVSHTHITSYISA